MAFKIDDYKVPMFKIEHYAKYDAQQMFEMQKHFKDVTMPGMLFDFLKKLGIRSAPATQTTIIVDSMGNIIDEYGE